MRHRSGNAFRKGLARDRRLLLVLGAVLVLAALLMAMCESTTDRRVGGPAVGAAGALPPIGGGRA